MRASRRWKGAIAIGAVGFVVGSVRLVAVGATGWMTWVWFVVAAAYAFVGVVARGLSFPERPEDVLGRREHPPRFVRQLRQPPRSIVAPRTRPGPESDITRRIALIQQAGEETLTRNRTANALATLAATVGIVLVFTGAGQHDSGDDDATSPPAPPGKIAPLVPGPTRPGSAAQPQQPDAG